MQLTEIQMLDKVLQWFAKSPDEIDRQPFTSRQSILKGNISGSIVKEYPELNTKEFLEWEDLILEKLVKDKYVSKLNELYSITFDGKIFSKAGGYKIFIRIQKISNRVRLYRDWLMIFGTWLAAIGALAFFLWEIYKHYYLHID